MIDGHVKGGILTSSFIYISEHQLVDRNSSLVLFDRKNMIDSVE